MRRTGVVALVVLASVAVWATGALAASSTKPPKTWVKQVCTAVATWSGDEVATLTAASKGLPAEATTTAAQAALVTTVATLADRTDELVIRLTRSGVPDVSGGKGAAGVLVAAFRTVADGLRTTRDGIKTTPVGDPSAFAASVRATTARLETLLGTVALDFSKAPLGGATLVKAAKGEKACRTLVAG